MRATFLCRAGCLTGIMPLAFALLALRLVQAARPVLWPRPARNRSMTAAFLLVALFVLLFLRVPIAIALGLSSILTMLLFAEQSLVALAQRFFSALQVYPLLAIPFFILAGALMTTGGVAKRMIAFANALVGHFRGGLAMAALLACALFAAVSGSSPATVVAVGSIMIAGMARSGYTREFAAGLICNAGTLGILIPPSIVMVVYGAVTETSIGDLFIAGVVPGLMLTAMLMAAVAVIARRLDLPRQPRADLRTVLQTGRDAIWGLAARRDHLGRHLSRHLHADRSGCRLGRVRVRDRGVRLSRPAPARRAARARRRGEGHGDADVHHRQRVSCSRSC